MTEDKKCSRKVNATTFFSKLAGILENPFLKSLQWDEGGQAVLVNAKLYEEEIEHLGEFLPGLQNFRSISMLHGLLCTFGFKKKVARINAELHQFQHVDFTRKTPVKIWDSDSVKQETSVNAIKKPKKSKKRKKERVAENPSTQVTGVVPQQQQVLENPHHQPARNGLTLLHLPSPEKPRRLRALYQYINYNNPEMNMKSDGESDTEATKIPGKVLQEGHTTTGSLPLKDCPQAGMKEGNLTMMKSLSLGIQENPELDKSTQVAIDKMLSVCASHLVPPLSPQYK